MALFIAVHITLNAAKEAGILGGFAFAVFYFVLVFGKKILIKLKTGKELSLGNP
ncbi:MAG: hypothetical protein MUO85_02690 [candidate division Zixibacteria bacterium]|nr:hypothetical protein [candidate division Zixibacteria bacterium]